jgi:hypothetical protein
MLAASMLSPNRKQTAIDHSLADLETKHLANKEKNQIGGEEATIGRTKAHIVASNCQDQTSPVVDDINVICIVAMQKRHPVLDLSELSDDGSNMNNHYNGTDNNKV